MSGMNKDTKAVIRRILSDIRVELGDEFDRNFERQAFFNDAWTRRKSPPRPGGTILVDTGTLRRSIRSRTTDDSITFYTDLPYAAIHNDGGEIVVTEKMKRFFWHKYYEATGSFGRKKNGERRNDKRTRQLSTEADFWRFMALKRAGTTIRIPRRRFLGTGPEVERIVREIIEDNLNEYFDMDFSIERK
jgi:phage gpG-like protein|nr:MAG TPA: tail morphogenesis protein [Caudoviricetes sp.]